MTFSGGSGLRDLERILDAFPRTFTIDDIESKLGISKTRIKQAIVWGNQTDCIRIAIERCAGNTKHVVYENIRWRAEWIKRSWKKKGRDYGIVVGDKQIPSGDADTACQGQYAQEPDIRDTTRSAIKASEQCLALLSKKASERAERSRLWNTPSAEA